VVVICKVPERLYSPLVPNSMYAVPASNDALCSAPEVAAAHAAGKFACCARSAGLKSAHNAVTFPDPHQIAAARVRHPAVADACSATTARASTTARAQTPGCNQ
jgi:hypothetical protein